MNQFIIDEKDLNRACDQMTAGGYGVSANYIDAMVRSHPLSAELKAERERILNDLKEWSYSIHVNNSALVAIQLREKIETLRGEP